MYPAAFESEMWHSGPQGDVWGGFPAEVFPDLWSRAQLIAQRVGYSR